MILDSPMNENINDNNTNTTNNTTNNTTTNTKVTTLILTPWESFVSCIKAAIGAGSFLLPYSFTSTSLFIAIPVTLCIGIISAYTLCLLLRCDVLIKQDMARQCYQQHYCNHHRARETRNCNDNRDIDIDIDCNIDRDIDNNRHNNSIDDNAHIVGNDGECINNHENSDDNDDMGHNHNNNNHQYLCQQTVLLTSSLSAIANRILTYPEIGGFLFPTYSYSIYGRSRNVLSDIVSFGILFTSIGVCAAYIDFVSSTLPNLLATWSHKRHHHADENNDNMFTITEFTLLLSPFLLLLSLMKDFRLLAWTSILGDIAVCIACLAVLIVGANAYFQHSTVTIPTSSTNSMPVSFGLSEIDNLPKFLGDLTFLFGIHIVSFPILQQTGNPIARPIANSKVAMGIYGFLSLFNICFGFLGCWWFASTLCIESNADGPCPNVLNNLKAGGALDAVKVLISLDLLFTFPIVLSAGRMIIEKELGVDPENYGASSEGNAVKSGIELQNNDVVEVSPFHRSARMQEYEPIDLIDGSSHQSTPNAVNSFDLVVNGIEKHQQNSLPMRTFITKSPKFEYNQVTKDSSSSVELNNDIDTLEFEVSNYTSIHHDRLHDSPSQAKLVIWDLLSLWKVRYLPWQSLSIRVGLVFVVLFLALCVPGFDVVVSMTGGVICSITGYVLPPIFYIQARQRQQQRQRFSDEAALETIKSLPNVSDELRQLEALLLPRAFKEVTSFERSLNNFIAVFGLFIIISNIVLNLTG